MSALESAIVWMEEVLPKLRVRTGHSHLVNCAIYFVHLGLYLLFYADRCICSRTKSVLTCAVCILFNSRLLDDLFKLN